MTATPRELLKGEEFTITASFTKKVNNVSDLTLTVDDKAQVQEELKLNGDGTSATAKYRTTKVGQCQISLKVKYGKVTKTASVDVQPQPEVTSVTANPETIDLGANTTITIAFDKAIKDVSELTLNVDNKLEVVTPLALTEGGGGATAVYRGTQAGTSNISAKTVKGGNTITEEVTITPDPTMTVDNFPATLQVDQTQILTINLTNATDYDVTFSVPDKVSYSKDSKVLTAVAQTEGNIDVTFTPKRASKTGTPIIKQITVNAK